MEAIDNDNLPALYYAIPHKAAGPVLDEWVTYNSARGLIRRLTELELFILRNCKGARPLKGHLIHLLACGVQHNSESLVRGLKSLADCGLLQRIQFEEQTGGTVLEPPSQDAQPVVGIVTADRPAVLRRCIEALIRKDHLLALNTTLLVIDNSRRAESEQSNRSYIEHVVKTHCARVQYIGALERRGICGALEHMGFDPPIVNFAFSGEAGANRNILQLLTVGSNLISVDDDVLCETWIPEGATNFLEIAGSEIIGTTEVFPGYREATSALKPSDADFITAHRRLLGRDLKQALALFRGHIDLSFTSRDILEWFHSEGDHVIRMSFMGVAGDSGVSCPYHMLLHSRLPYSQGHDRLRLPLHLSSRAIRRAVSSTVVTQVGYCMSYCAGFANREPLPPFMPKGRNEDGLFGQTLRYCDPGALSVHLPEGIFHLPTRASWYGTGQPPRVRPRLSDFLIAPTVGPQTVPSTLGFYERMERLGSRFEEIARFSDVEFSNYSAEVAVDLPIRSLLSSTRLNEYTAMQMDALEIYMRHLAASVGDKSAFIPLELDEEKPEDTRRVLRQFIGLYGQLMCVWPAMRQVATQLRDCWVTRSDKRKA